MRAPASGKAGAEGVACVVFAISAAAQDLPPRWDELTASDWPKALEKSARTAILPIGILEKADNPAEGKAWRAWVPLVIFPVISCRLLLRLMQCLIAQARRNRLDFWSRG